MTMKRRLAQILVTMAMMSIPLLWAISTRQSEAQVTGISSVPLGYQQITSLGTAAALTVPSGARTAVITAEAQAVRYRDDGVAPSATVGMPLAVGTALTYSGTLSAIQFIEQTSGAKLNILYYR